MAFLAREYATVLGHVKPRSMEDQLAPMTRSRNHFTPHLWIGGILVSFLLVVAMVAPFIAPYPPEMVMAGARLAPPSLPFPFGTDSLGRDIFSRVLLGARLAVWTMVLGAGIAGMVGIIPGLVAGYKGGWVDQVLSRTMDLGFAFPGLILAIVIVARLGPSLENAIIAMGVISAPGFFRLVRSQTISARKALYVDAARSIGASDVRILFRHIWPNLMSSVIVIATIRAGMVLLATSGLSFIGLGAQPPTPEWGTMLASGRNYLDTAPWLAIFPGLCITLTVIGTSFLGDGLRDLSSPWHRWPGQV